MRTPVKFDKGLVKLIFVCFVVVGVLQLQMIEFEYRRSERALATAYRSGEKSRELEAMHLGLGRMDGTNFVWNTNIFSSLDLAMDSVIKSEKRAVVMADTCLRLAKVTIETGEMMKNFKEAEEAEETKEAENIKKGVSDDNGAQECFVY